ncbi:hypothetical protein R1sor_017919 [Riccia sorocarpa]|uniref:Reverse transcriptase zinc-binding domain-containing protein n=1 Tax=Riccia sorocarpa TaxID=122646 RepID=A0ABD3ICA0_9MARC
MSGTKLNINKSLIMPIRPAIPPQWVHATGCEIAGAGRSFKYLGISTSNPIDETQVARCIVKKMEQKLKHWSNKLLSRPAKTLLLKQVLAATLNQLMSVGLHSDGIEELEKLCRQFLWGWSEDGSPKASMVAWERLARGKFLGGIGWTQLKTKAQAMYIKAVLKIVRGADVEWVSLANNLILRNLRKGKYQREHRQWRLEDSVLLLKITKVTGSATLSRMFKAWSKMRHRIHWDKECTEIPAHLTIAQAWRDRLAAKGLFPEEEEVVRIQELEYWLSGKALTPITLLQTKGWKWNSDNLGVRWDGELKEWSKRPEDNRDFSDYLNEKWHSQETTNTWSQRWRKLWAAPVSYRRKIWIWRFMQRGYYLNSRGAGKTEEEKRCLICGFARETVEHTFWACTRLQRRMTELQTCGVLQHTGAELIVWLDSALDVAQQDSQVLYTHSGWW